jgi:transcription-repair coupling factor (superfamily II helicase)
MIIESGIDIPNANTIIVNNAHMFGLSDLHQLRGRVGRFNRSAYAYFMIPKNLILDKDVKKRLHAISEYSQLGSGFNIAMEDLEIRGAGNLLGVEQHGFISSVGFDLYCRLLREAISSLKKAGVFNEGNN